VDLTVAGADELHFVDGRGSCLTFLSSIGYNNEVRHIRVFLLDLWAPAIAPRHKLELRVEGYRGPGTTSKDDAQRLRYDPANGEIVKGDAYVVPSADRIGVARAVAVTVVPDETSGTLKLDFPDRTIAGNWRCVASHAKTELLDTRMYSIA